MASQFTDVFWLGRLGGKAIAAVAMSLPLIFFLTSLGIGLAIAGATLTAQYFGAKDEKNLSQAAGQTLLMIVSVSCFHMIYGSYGLDSPATILYEIGSQKVTLIAAIVTFFYHIFLFYNRHVILQHED